MYNATIENASADQIAKLKTIFNVEEEKSRWTSKNKIIHIKWMDLFRARALVLFMDTHKFHTNVSIQNDKGKKMQTWENYSETFAKTFAYTADEPYDLVAYVTSYGMEDNFELYQISLKEIMKKLENFRNHQLQEVVIRKYGKDVMTLNVENQHTYHVENGVVNEVTLDEIKEKLQQS